MTRDGKRQVSRLHRSSCTAYWRLCRWTACCVFECNCILVVLFALTPLCNCAFSNVSATNEAGVGAVALWPACVFQQRGFLLLLACMHACFTISNDLEPRLFWLFAAVTVVKCCLSGGAEQGEWQTPLQGAERRGLSESTG